MLNRLKYLVRDPPPLVVIEFAERSAAAARRDPKTFAPQAWARRPVEAGVIAPSATKPNIQDPERLARIVAELLDELGPLKRCEAALILPDGSSRLSVLDFENFPSDAAQRLALIKFRLEKSVPFDLDSARIAYQVRRSGEGWRALTAVTPSGVVRQYEEALESVGLWPGYVTSSMASTLNLAPGEGSVLIAKLSGCELTMAALDAGEVRLIRTVEVADTATLEPARAIEELTADLYPTIVFVTDNLGSAVERVVLCGFGALLPAALERLPSELGCEVEPLRSLEGVVDGSAAGIWGLLSAA